MQVPSGLDPVGRWYFAVTCSTVTADALIHEMATALASALEVVETAELLLPEELSCERWLGRQGRKLARADVLPMTISTNNLNKSAIESIVRRYLVNQNAVQKFPAELTIRGSGWVFNQTERTEKKLDLCSLRVAYDAGDVIIVLETNSDVWLPYDLQANPQPVLAATNAPRLIDALHALAARFRSEPETGSISKYAVVRPYGLENVRDVESDVIATADW